MMHQKSIENWLENVAAHQASFLRVGNPDPSHDGDTLEVLPSPPSTSPQVHLRKRKCEEGDTPLQMPDSEPVKRVRATGGESESASSVPGSLRDDITLPPTRSQSAISSRSRQRSASPNCIKANLSTATPKVKYLPESTDPGSDLPKRLLAFLTEDSGNGWEPDEHEIKAISAASRKCELEMRSEGSWVIDVARPLLKCAIGALPLECWSVQTESVDPKFQPRYTTRDVYNRKIDLVVGLPREEWAAEYEFAAAHFTDGCLSHVSHPHTGSRLLGPGVEVKASDGNLVEAQVQLGVWMAGLVTWMMKLPSAIASAPPVVGCISIGERWEFYIIYGMEGRGSDPAEVCVWGPLEDLDARTGSHKAIYRLLKTLRRVMEYTQGQYIRQLLRECIA